MQKKIILSILIFLYSCGSALALGFALSGSVGYIGINDPKYRDIGSSNYSNSINVGISERLGKNYIFSIQTNRFLNHSLKKQVINNQGIVFDNKTRIISDSIFAAKLFGRTFLGVTISNVGVNRKLYYSDKLAGTRKNHAILYGASVGYLLTKNTAASISYILPNKELNLEGASFLGINYFF